MNEGENIFSYLKSFILLSPLFNLENQPFQNIVDYIDELHLDTPNIISNAYSSESKTDKCEDSRLSRKSMNYGNYEKQSGENKKYSYETKEQEFGIDGKKEYKNGFISDIDSQLVNFVKNNKNFNYEEIRNEKNQKIKVNYELSRISNEQQFIESEFVISKNSDFNEQIETINEISFNETFLFTDPKTLFDFIFRGKIIDEKDEEDNKDEKDEIDKKDDKDDKDKKDEDDDKDKKDEEDDKDKKDGKDKKENSQLEETFIKEIRDIINCMETILYMPPYSILFGRIDLNIPKTKPKPPVFYRQMKSINKLFYEGFGIDINSI
ncbi:hypothetical protein M9Y10_018622 [Tritrichomonas musculus]|uniref:Uncharacterized protein n=1 Tax=Tritrichomonas musculus TaxID=1915356 RepID=A0ABR2HN92_9EUKA